ncbi:hypothetical protein N8987_03435 [Crocinitomix sp.]|nr:hypothetical protein [Crocinitomix sp.]
MKLLITFLLLSSVSFGQSKKEQIIALNTSIDSLNTVLSTTRDNASKDINLLNDKIKEILDEVTALKTDLEEMSKMNLELEGKISAYSQDNLVGGIDGNIQSLNTFSKNYNSINAWDESYLKFQKYPLPNSKQDILQWLKQFEVSSETNVVYDYDVDPEDWKGVTGMHLTIYKNGIILQKLSGYEGLSIRIEFPFLSVKDAQLLFKQFVLLELALGCGGEDDMEVNYKYSTETMSTTVYFRNGC